jgi:L-ribulose-5-phosphate 4-epimerase
MKVVKFKCEWEKKPAVLEILVHEAIIWRNRLFKVGLIGVEKGLGFGNLSVRLGNTFLITGTQTGHLHNISAENFSLVTKTDISKNQVFAEGPVKPSSEALTHAAIYEKIPNANAIIHVHNKKLWQEFKGKLPTSGKDIEYGSIELANDIKRLYEQTDLKLLNIFVVGGHEDGLFTYGSSLEEAGEVIMDYAITSGAIK